MLFQAINIELPFMAELPESHPKTQERRRSMNSASIPKEFGSLINYLKLQPVYEKQWKKCCGLVVYNERDARDARAAQNKRDKHPARDIKVVRWLSEPRIPNETIRRGPTVPTWYAVIGKLGDRVAGDRGVRDGVGGGDAVADNFYALALGSDCRSDDNSLESLPFRDNASRGYEDSKKMALGGPEERKFCEWGVSLFKSVITSTKDPKDSKSIADTAGTKHPKDSKSTTVKVAAGTAGFQRLKASLWEVPCKITPPQDCSVCMVDHSKTRATLWACCGYSEICLDCSNKVGRCVICKTLKRDTFLIRL